MLLPRVPGIGEALLVLRVQQGEGPVPEHRVLLAQGDEPLIEVEDGIRVRQLCPSVDLSVIGIHGHPGGPCGKARLRRIVPLRRRPGIVTALNGQG